MIPDEKTNLRLLSLSRVGKVLGDPKSLGSDYLLAKDALDEFSSQLNLVELTSEIREGMNSLIKYLESKINENLQGSNVY